MDTVAVALLHSLPGNSSHLLPHARRLAGLWALLLVFGAILARPAAAQISDPDYCVTWKGADPELISPSLSSWGPARDTELDQGYVTRTLSFTINNPDNQPWSMCIRTTSTSSLGTYGSGSGSKPASDLQWRLVSVTSGNVGPPFASPESTSFTSILSDWRYITETVKQSGSSSILVVTLEFRMLLSWGDEPGSYGLPIELIVGHRDPTKWTP